MAWDSAVIHFMVLPLQLSKTKYYLKLHTQPAPDRPKRRYKDCRTVSCDHRNVPLRQQIVAIRDCFPVSEPEMGQLLPHGNVQKGIHLEHRFPVIVESRQRGATHPLVSTGYLCVRLPRCP